MAIQFLAVPLFFTLAPVAVGCEVLFIQSGEALVRLADTIIVATPVEYITGLSGVHKRDEPIRFRVTETLRGIVRRDIALPGNLTDQNDFNDRPAPYNAVRPGGRHGNCFANSYRIGTEYLLFLKTTESGGLTVTWSPLAPVNEQLHSATDPWLLWVRKELHRVFLESK